MSLCISANTAAKITLHLSIIIVNDTQGLFIVCLTIIIVNARDVSTAYYWSSSADDVQFAERHCYPLLLVMGTFRTSILGFLFPSLASLVFRNSNGPLLYRSAAVVNLVPEVSVWSLIVGIHASGIAI